MANKGANLTKNERKLTPKQQRFVDELVSGEGGKQAAAERAGYAKGKSAASMAWKLTRMPIVQQAIMTAVSERIGVNAAHAAAEVARLSTGARSEYVKLEASKDILDRAGYKPVDRKQVQVAGDIRVAIDLS